MTVGEWLVSVGVRQLVTMPGVPTVPGTPPPLPAPDEACARLLATAAGALDHGPGAIWDGEVLTLLTAPPTRPGPPRPLGPGVAALGGAQSAPPTQAKLISAPAALVTALAAARARGTSEIRLRLGFPLDSPGPAPAPTPAPSTAPAPAETAETVAETGPGAGAASEVVGALLPRDDAPLNPARATADVAEVLPANGIILADPGAAGLWVEHTGPASGAQVRVTAVGGGVAVAGALLAWRRGQVGVAVVEQPPTGTTATLLRLASELDADLVVEVWGQRGGLRSAADHRERLASALGAGGVRVIEVPVDFTATKVLVDAIGDAPAGPGH
ncbi:hypothetical protein [Parafrankia discariae]|uniref:hypothetical protein n=1 Tax=Parafrankia discariae TaxID=365528 RepID=UPI00037DEB55|nr:hypothetical protein [Parafrankia discariae]